MKTVVLTMAVWALTAAASYGQVRAVQRGSAAEAQLRAEHRQAMGDTAEQRAEREKALETGRSLFGVDERLTGPSRADLVGTLVRKAPTDYGIGDWGYTGLSFQVLNKVSDTECLVLPKYKGAEVMLLRGFDMSKVTDGVEFILQHPTFIQETYTYPTVAGGRKTVLVLERNEQKVAEILAKARAKRDAELAAAEAKRTAGEAARKTIEDAKRRTWTSASGAHQTEAKFVTMAAGLVRLEKDDGQRIEVPLEQLSKDDQDFIRNREWLKAPPLVEEVLAEQMEPAGPVQAETGEISTLRFDNLTKEELSQDPARLLSSRLLAEAERRKVELKVREYLKASFDDWLRKNRSLSKTVMDTTQPVSVRSASQAELDRLMERPYLANQTEHKLEREMIASNMDLFTFGAYWTQIREATAKAADTGQKRR